MPTQHSETDALHNAEEAVLSACLTGELAAIATAQRLAPARAFRSRRNQLTAEAVYALATAGSVVDPLTVSTELERRGDLERVGGNAFIGQLIDAVPTAANVEYHAKIVREEHQRRTAMELLDSALSKLQRKEKPTREIVTQAYADLLGVAVDADTRGYRAVTDLELDVAVGRINERGAITRIGGVPGFPTGYSEIDRDTSGFRPGELVVIGGVPKSQKTNLCLNIAVNAARRGDVVGVVSAEMKWDAVLERLLASTANVPLKALARGDLVEAELAGLRRLAYPLADRIWIDDEAFPELSDVVARATELKTRVPALKLLIIDYLQLIGNRLDGRRGDEEINMVCRALKGIAKRLDVPVLAPAQCNYKEIDSRSNKRPELRDLQGASGMAQTADFVGLIYNPVIYDQTAAPTLELDFKACRRTSPFTAYLRFDPASLQITSRELRPGWAA